jgi:NAD(P)-dependent dehydrogenase (short-subunit alcohol dehydrogenase family)
LFDGGSTDEHMLVTAGKLRINNHIHSVMAHSPVPRYTYNGPVDHTILVDRSKVKGKSVIITGGANGIGEVAARQFVADGAFVTIGDLNVERGEVMERELKGRLKFVKCNIGNWQDQIALFDAAVADGRGLDVVVANAGISRSSGDSLWNLDGEFSVKTSSFVRYLFFGSIDEPYSDPNGPPLKPDLNIINVNINGTLYTFKLAVHYFRKQPVTRDRCFMMTGSLGAWIDSPVCILFLEVRHQC